MKTGNFCARLAVLPLALSVVTPSYAQPQLKETVITATRTAKPVGDVVADVTIIDKSTIERAGAAGLADLLARVPGLEFARNGGMGNATSVFLRGGESRHTAVLVDGVRLDSQNVSGGANWNAIPLAQIDHIEIVRGPTSAVYGSDAVAGVIQIFTKKGESGFSPSITLGYGTYNTQKVDFAASGGSDVVDYSIGLSGGRSDGFNIRPVAPQNPDDDGYLNNSANVRVGWQLSPQQRVEVSALQSRMDAQYDSATLKDDRSINVNTTQSLQWIAQWSDSYTSRVSLSQGLDQGRDLPSDSNNRTQIDSALVFNEYKLGKQSFNATLEQRNDAFQLSGVPRIDKSKSQAAVGLGYAWTGEMNTVQLSARNDNDSEFGGKTTTSVAYAFAFTPEWRASVSTATSFRVPTLYQRFSKYGVSTLLPESGRNVELGVKYVQGSSEFGVVVYRNTLTNLLSFLSGSTATGCPVPANGCYGNTAEARYQGIGISGRKDFAGVRAWGSLDIQDPRDAVNGTLLVRRATHHAAVGLDTHLQAWTVGADMQLSSLRYDDVANNVVLPGYVLVNLTAQKKVSKDWSVLLRVDNAADTKYQLANTYATAGRALYAGLTWAP
jgi:vitamin B12 transporter